MQGRNFRERLSGLFQKNDPSPHILLQASSPQEDCTPLRTLPSLLQFALPSLGPRWCLTHCSWPINIWEMNEWISETKKLPKHRRSKIFKACTLWNLFPWVCYVLSQVNKYTFLSGSNKIWRFGHCFFKNDNLITRQHVTEYQSVIIDCRC